VAPRPTAPPGPPPPVRPPPSQPPPHLPPPPAVALIIIGNPTSPATWIACSSFSISPALPGTVGTPAWGAGAGRGRGEGLFGGGWECRRALARCSAPPPPCAGRPALPPTLDATPPNPPKRPPTFFIVSRAVALSPITLICAGLGPINSRPWSVQISTKLAFSDRKP
jgi:hypothetical protein